MPDDASVVLGPKLGQVNYANIGANFPNSLRNLLRALDALVQASVLSVTLATPPGSPSDGDAYIVAASPTGAWAGQANNLAVWSAEIATADTNTKVPAWEFHAPKAGWRAFNAGDGDFYSYNGSAWISITPRMTFCGFITDGTAQGLGSYAQFTPDRPITVTRVEIVLGSAGTGQTTAAVISVTDGVTPINTTLANGVAVFSSGAIAVNYAAGVSVKIMLATVSAGGTKQVSIMVVVEYKPQ